MLLLLAAAAAPAGGPKKPLLDAYGDPLPPGATARFGTVRWRHPGVDVVAFSPDGKRVASADRLGFVAVWEVETGRELHHFAGHKPQIGCLVFSPDGQYLVAGGGDPGGWRIEDNLIVWDLPKGMEKQRFFPQKGWTNYVAFSPDGKTLVTSGGKHPVIAWHFPSGKKLREFRPKSGDLPSHRCAISPNGQWLAVNEDGKTLSLYEFATGKKRYQIEVADGFALRLEFSPDNRSLLTVEAGGLRIWEVASGKLRLHIELGASFWRKACFSPDGKKLALIDSDNDIQWFDAFTGKALGAWKGHRAWVNCLAFSRDGRAAVSGSGDGTIRVWDAATGKTLKAPPGPVVGCGFLRYSLDGKSLLAGSPDLHFLDAQTLQEQHRVEIPLDWWREMAVSSNEALAAIVGQEGRIIVVDLQKRKVVRALHHVKWQAHSIAFAPDGQHLYVLARDFASKNAGSGPPSPGAGTPPALVALHLWDVETGAKRRPLWIDRVALSAGAVSPKGKLAVCADTANSQVCIWDLATGKEEKSIPCQADSLLFLGDGNLLVTRYLVLKVIVWDMKGRTALGAFRGSQEKGVVSWSCSFDGKLLATGHTDGSLTIWNLADGKKVAEVEGHRSSVWSLAFSPDGKSLVSGSNDGTVLKWDAAAWRGK
jgi:WD40 repeat protein